MEAKKHNSQGKTIVLRIGLSSPLETTFFVESLFSDQMDHVHGFQILTTHLIQW